MSAECLADTHGLKEMKMRWSNTIELYPLAMQTSEFGVFRSMISVDATFEGWKVTSELNSTPAPIPMMKAPAIRAVVRFLDTQPPPLLSDESAWDHSVMGNGAMIDRLLDVLMRATWYFHMATLLQRVASWDLILTALDCCIVPGCQDSSDAFSSGAC